MQACSKADSRLAAIVLSRPSDLASLEPRWRALEAEADAPFFQGWTWTGCLATERFPDSVLLEAKRNDRTVALGLFNRRSGLPPRLHLGESGIAALDTLFIEHNGLLLAPGSSEGLASACLRAARGAKRLRAVALGGIGDATLAAARQAGGGVVVQQSRTAPFLDLERAVSPTGDPLDALSANTRQQVRRSMRRYAETGPLALDRAETAAEAHAWLDALAALHQAYWIARGRPGAFANPAFGRFHHTLIDRAIPRSEVDLLRVRAGDRPIGYLYNFRLRGRVSAYQSGFDYADADAQRKPGLTCHALALAYYAKLGCRIYDFLAGDDRYKRSLSRDETALHWISLEPPCSPVRLRESLKASWQRLRAGAMTFS